MEPGLVTVIQLGALVRKYSDAESTACIEVAPGGRFTPIPPANTQPMPVAQSLRVPTACRQSVTRFRTGVLA